MVTLRGGFASPRHRKELRGVQEKGQVCASTQGLDGRSQGAREVLLDAEETPARLSDVFFPLQAEYAINVGPRGAWDGRAREKLSGERIPSQAGEITGGITAAWRSGLRFRLLPALLRPSRTAELQDDLPGVRLLHVLLGFLLRRAALHRMSKLSFEIPMWTRRGRHFWIIRVQEHTERDFEEARTWH